MTIFRLSVFWAALALAAGPYAGAQARPEQDLSDQGVLSLSFANNRQHISAAVGQQIEITLGIVGPARYGEPQVSSPAVRFADAALDVARINPGGAIGAYIFEAAAEGEAHIVVPVIDALSPEAEKQNTFAVTIRVAPASGTLPQRRSFLLLDQENTALWNNQWVNLAAVPRQSFVPSMPKIAAVEVELVAAKPGQVSGVITMALTDAEGTSVLAWVEKDVDAADCSHVEFPLPYGGVSVSPGQVYSIRLDDYRGVFGWKYVVGGYANGTAFWYGEPPSGDSRFTFLFRTFGANCGTNKDCGVPAHAKP